MVRNDAIREKILGLGADVCGFHTVDCNKCRRECPMRDGLL